MQLEAPNEKNVITDDADGGCTINVSEAIVLIEEPSANQLRQHLIDMEAKLKSRLKDLLCLPFRTVCERYGTLGFNADSVEERNDIPYGALVRSGEHLAHFRKGAIIRGLVLTGDAPPGRDGKPRGKMSPGMGGKAADVFSGLPADKQREIMRALIDMEELDDFYRFGQTSLAGLEALRTEVTYLTNEDVPSFLTKLAGKVGHMIHVASAKGNGESAAKGTGYEYAPMWFSMYLAQKFVWLLPMNIASSVRRAFFPGRLLPLTVYMALPDSVHNIADHMLSVAKDSRFHVSYSLNLFVASSLSSTMWSTRRFCPRPWREMKYRSASEDVSSAPRSSAANLVYREVAGFFDIEIEERPDFNEFMSMKRLWSKSSDFHWTRHPTQKSTKNVAALVGRPITAVPPAVVRWADTFLEMLPAFEVKLVRRIVYMLNMYLAFLIFIDEKDIPDDFLRIDREHAKALWSFIHKHYGNKARRSDLDVMGKMKMAWDIAARQEGFPANFRNPFDIPLDSYPQASTNASDREGMDPRVAAFLSDLNCKDDYAFARTIDRCWAIGKNRYTGLNERKFVGNEAKVLDICLNYGLRLIDGRNLDSGEGDEFLLDIEHPEELIRNQLECAQKDRQQGVVQRFWYHGPPAEWKLGIFRAHDKSNRAKYLPHLEPRIAKMLRDHALLQSAYNYLPHPLQMIDRKNKHQAASKEKIVIGWPVFRNFKHNRKVMITSEENCRDYAKQFFEYAQPLLNEYLGRNYPLFIDGKPRFRIHDLRVTNASEIYDLPGGTVQDAAGLLGHANHNTAYIYLPMKSERIHRMKQLAVERRRESLLSPQEILTEAVETNYTPAHIKKHAGVESGRRMIQSGNYSKLAKFNHGVCPGGDCGKGGPMIGNKPTPVWRLMACPLCRFRLAGPKYLDGIKDNINLLSWEIFNSVQREQELNEEFNRLEAAGEPQVDRSASRIEADRRENIMAELKAEVQTHRDMCALKQALEMKGLPTDNILLPTSEGYNPEHVEYGFIPGSEWELLFEIAGVQSVPHSVIQTSPLLLPRWNELTRQMMRAVKVEDVLLHLPKRQQEEAIRTFAKAAVEHFGANEITCLLSEPVDLASYPNLEHFADEVKARISTTKGITGATN